MVLLFAVTVANTFKLIDEVKAGDGHEPILQAGEAIRIFTGAPVPSTADTVVRQEDTHVENSVLTVDTLPTKGANIRPKAEQISEGEIALEKGHRINEASIGYLATLGITFVDVYQKPVVSILVTGNELVDPGAGIEIWADIRKQCTHAWLLRLKKWAFDRVAVYRVRDDYQSTKSNWKKF
jgi:molybdopterin molybdotransferase